MKTPELEKAVKAYAKYVVQQAKSNLSKKGKRASNSLYNSIEPVFEFSKDNFFVSFKMANYGAFQDRGVRGTESYYADEGTASSPFKFGTGSGPKGGLTKGIGDWIKLKKFQFRDKRGRFMSYKSMQYIIVNSIWRRGLRATLFFSTPFEKGIQRFGDDFLNAYLLDVEKDVILGIKK
ncbi:MAG: hypothetical protein Unbinned306contig1002_33 [Prokaryotic dsDNA virus sp.]|nr:MAG: hypothetical protein Unbinned306contig1002_33 [Prokaryotic dsDNA virus sp.]|tara:strand:- start:12454 stop:12987 length:534 start_codon:yes stop_codon:yes gene_type:complete